MPTSDRDFWIRLYAGASLKELPWFNQSPFPPLVQDVDAGVLQPPGPVLDVGCGVGTNTHWLASRGFQATGVDLAPGAIAAAEARRRSGDRTTAFHIDDVLASSLPAASFRSAVDIGCFQTLPPRKRTEYVVGLSRLLRPESTMLLYWVAREEEGAWGPPHRLSVDEVVAPFEPLFRVEEVTHRPRTTPLTPQVKRSGRPLALLAGYTARLVRRTRPQPPPR